MISKRLAGLLGALALAVLVFVWRIATRPVVGPGDAAYRQALDARDRGESETAVARLQQAIMSEPGNGEYHSDLGHLYVEIRRFDLAAAEFEAAAFLLPPAAAPTANAWLARCLVELRRREESLAVVELALKQDPRLAVAYAVRGEQRLRDDNLNEALSDFRKTLELSPDFGLAYQKAGYILYQSQQYEEAKQMLERGLQRNPGDVGAHLLLAQTLLQLGGDPPTQALAEQHLRAALVNNPEAHRVHAALGQLALRRNQLAEARAAFEASLSTHPRFQEARFGLAQVAQRDGKAAEAARHRSYVAAAQKLQRELNELLARSVARPDEAGIGLRLARQCLEVGALEDAERALARVIAQHPDLREARELRARLFEQQRQSARADRENQIAQQLPRTSP